MKDKIDIKDIIKIISETFNKNDISSNIEDLKLGHIEEWDSLGNFNLLLAFEDYYSIRFTMNEIAAIKSASQIIDSISNKLTKEDDIEPE